MKSSMVRFSKNILDSFVNAPVVTDLNKLEADIAIIGAPYGIPYEMGQTRSYGAADYIRDKSMRFCGEISNDELTKNSIWKKSPKVKLADCGNIVGDPMDFPGTMKRTTKVIRDILSCGTIPIVIGGDDAVPIPVAKAYEEYGPLVVVQLDQHIDYMDSYKNVKEGYCSPIRRMREMPWVDKIFHVGFQGSGINRISNHENKGEFALINEEGMYTPEPDIFRDSRKDGNFFINARNIHDKGVNTVLEKIPDKAKFFIVMDVDSMDGSVFPAASHPEPGGLTYWEASDLLKGVARKGHVLGMVLTEMVPDHDLHGLAGRVACRLFLDLISAMAESEQIPH